MSCRFSGASTGTANLHRSQHVSRFDPAFQLAVVSNSVDRNLSSLLVPQDTTTCRERGASIVPLGTKLAHTHDGSVDFTYLKCDPDFASISKFHRNCLLTIVFQFVSARRYQVRIPARLNGDPLEVSRRAHMLICAVVHQNVYNMPIFGLYECFSVV